MTQETDNLKTSEIPEATKATKDNQDTEVTFETKKAAKKPKKKGCLKKMLLWLLISPIILAVLLFLIILIYLQHPKFGAKPQGQRLEKILSSPHYWDGKFHNYVEIENVVDDSQDRGSLKDLFFPKGRGVPQEPLPTIKSDLKSLKDGQMVWFGHSSFLLRLGNKHFLVDPVFSPYASPIFLLNRAFKGTNIYTTDDLPEIDYVLISHDHWDHLDYQTMIDLKPKVKKVACGLGVGAHLERWGYTPEMLLEGQWGDSFSLEDGVTITLEHAQHFSGRTFKWNQTMWTAYVIQAGNFKIFYSGDGGYGEHFARIGEKWGSFDLALMEDGQYNQAWHSIHLFPEESVKAVKEMNTQRMFPVHNSKFRIAYHDWDDPLIRAKNEADRLSIRLLTPLIGQVVNITDDSKSYNDWWEKQN
jgi:L-ascorbate metabolism protein UlaG (beta-lactamase superfamily)